MITPSYTHSHIMNHLLNHKSGGKHIRYLFMRTRQQYHPAEHVSIMTTSGSRRRSTTAAVRTTDNGWRKRPASHARWLSGSSSSKEEEEQADQRKQQQQRDAEKKLDPRLSEWIPPDRPLAGDKGYSHLYKSEQKADNDNAQQQQQEEQIMEFKRIEREIKLLEDEVTLTEQEQLERIEQEIQLLEKDEIYNTSSSSSPSSSSSNEQEPSAIVSSSRKATPQTNIDWLATRRKKLGDDNTSPSSSLLTPSYDKPVEQQQYELPVIRHTLLTANEIMKYMISLGGINVNLINDIAMNEHGDTRLGGAYRGIVFVTGHNASHVRMLSSSLVAELKRRKLYEVGVQGARHGADGNIDDNNNDETWLSIDCHNYIVNIMDERTREILQLEQWWSQSNPMREYHNKRGNNKSSNKKKKKNRNKADEDAEDEMMEEFISQNPVPPDYGRAGLLYNGSSGKLSDLEHKRWTSPDNHSRAAGLVHRSSMDRRRKKTKGKKRW